MAGSSLLTLLDDIASLLDDVATLTNIAARKTAGVLGDDLALNAQQVAGLRAERELPVVWKVAKGSARNKLIIVPAALAISAVAHWAVSPLLMIGGAYLCFEGVEKLVHTFLQPKGKRHAHEVALRAAADTQADLMAFENAKITGAIRTDFVLSAEIVTITLGGIADVSFGTRVAVLTVVASVMTIGVYGLVAGIVKLDDLGYHLVASKGSGSADAAKRSFGRAILIAAPWLMKGLSAAGTVAMFLVGGEILAHGVPAVYHAVEAAQAQAATVATMGGVLAALVPLVLNGLVGVISGAVVVALVTGGRKVWSRLRGTKVHVSPKETKPS